VGIRSDEGEVVNRIREILEHDIRPYVAQDGGEIIFAGFRDGVVEVYLQGACAGCPSSTATLKFGIEARLREEIPEITEVVAL
jgi:Fe-S cluster biogenesis protein NfuA